MKNTTTLQTDYNWLAISISVNKNDWMDFLKNSIRTFINNEAIRSKVRVYLLEFSHDTDTIKLSLLTRDVFIKELVKQAEGYFNSYFASLTSASTLTDSHTNTDLILYSTNNIQCDIHASAKINNNIEKFAIPNLLSELMLDVLSDETIDDNTILSFSFYLSIGLISVLLKNSPSSIIELLNLYDLSNYINEDFESNLELEFKKNQTILLDIVNNIFNERSMEIPSWLLMWMKLCDKELKNTFSCFLRNDTHFVIHNRIVYHIYKQLSINKNSGFLLTYFCKKALELIVKGNTLSDLKSLQDGKREY
jgi:hypothetical protein